MSLTAQIDAVRHVVDAEPGLSRAALARKIRGGRREQRLEVIQAALRAGVVVEAIGRVPAREGSQRTVRGLYAASDVGEVPAGNAKLTGAQLAEHRTSAGISVKALARALRVSYQLVQHWEAGRQRVPGWVGGELERACQVAAAAPRRNRGNSRHGFYLAEIVKQVRHDPGVTRYRLGVREGSQRAEALAHALDAGLVHEAPTVVRAGRSRHLMSGYFPGARPRVTVLPVRTTDLREARKAAGWPQTAMADRLGIKRSTLEHWELHRDRVPLWAATEARAALAEARAKTRDVAAYRGNTARELLEECPGGLSETQLAHRMGYERSDRVHALVEELIASGLAHRAWAGRRGQREVVLIGPAPATAALTGHELRDLRKRAGLLQREVASVAGVGVQVIRDWERGSGRRLTHAEQQTLRQLLLSRPDVEERLRLALLEAMPATRHQLDRLRLAHRGQVTAALAELTATGRSHVGRVEVVDSNGQRFARRGYVSGPAPHVMT
jgi:DNA-binding transcriptional regulator YiaG